MKLLLALFLAPLIQAQQQPTTLVVLDIGSDSVAMKLHVPLSELELAFAHDVTKNPQAFTKYLTDHIHPVTPAGQPWFVQVQEMKIAGAKQTQSGPF